MFLLRRPSPADVDAFLLASRDLPLTYGPVGLANRTPSGFAVDSHSIVIGNGPAAFERAIAALTAWKHFDLSWAQVFPPRAAIAPGTVVAVAVRHLGFWSINGCRIVSVTDDRAAGAFAFAYGTLSNHAECGEEIFTVRLDARTDDVAYEIRAVSRPHAALARAGYPVTRMLQARFRRDSAIAMRRAVGGV